MCSHTNANLYLYFRYKCARSNLSVATYRPSGETQYGADIVMGRMGLQVLLQGLETPPRPIFLGAFLRELCKLFWLTTHRLWGEKMVNGVFFNRKAEALRALRRYGIMILPRVQYVIFLI